MARQMTASVLVCIAMGCTALGGPYKEIGVAGYVDLLTRRHADPDSAEAWLNPIFRGWATGVVEYAPSDTDWKGPWNMPAKALGPVTGQNFDIVSLGELDPQEIAEGLPPGHITLTFGDPDDPANEGTIRNGAGYDFVVFENGMMSHYTTKEGSLTGQLLAELGYVEISSNGEDYARFPSVSLTPALAGAYGTVDVTDIHNLAGKYPNSYGLCMGTPFDLDDLTSHPDVVSGRIDLNAIRYMRIVDVPGSGDFTDDAMQHVDPGTGPGWTNYAGNRPIYDQWPTRGSGGFDLEAVGVLHEQQYSADVNLDGQVDYHDLSLLADAWQSSFGGENWNSRCDLAKPRRLLIDGYDFAVFANQWGRAEQWRAEFKEE